MATNSVAGVLNEVAKNLGVGYASLSTTGLVVKASYNGTVTATRTITGRGIIIDNTGGETITLTVNSISIPIPKGYIFDEEFDVFSSFSIVVPTVCTHLIIVKG